MLYLVSTPIGNLGDLSSRAVEVLNSCDEILCEDTRHTSALTRHFNITTPLRSYHKFNEAKQLGSILSKIQNGQDIALVSDAGTPAIHDPGERLTQACCKENIPFTAIPGPCALIQALVLSGLPTTPFQFCGFVPRKGGEKRKFLASCLCYPGTTILYESPRRVMETLEQIALMSPLRDCCIARELTKKFEESLRAPAEELLQIIKNRDGIKGECVLLFAGEPAQEKWLQTPPLELVKDFEEKFQLPSKEALKLTAELTGLSKRELYRQNLND